MTRSLSGRTVLISGAGSGLGRATALRLARGGAHVVVGDIDERGAAETVTLVQSEGLTGSWQPLDVSNPDSCREVVGRVRAEHGPAFDGLVNNAGLDRGASVLDLTAEQWSTVIGVNQSGPLFLTQAFLRALDLTATPTHPADVVTIISISAITVGTDAAAYNSSKAALAMLTRIMQREALEYRWPVRIAGVLPSAMDTPMMEQWHLSPEVMMAPDTVASAVEFAMTLPPDSYVQNLVINSRNEPGWPR